MSLPPDAQALVDDVKRLATQAIAWTGSKKVAANIKAIVADMQKLTALWPVIGTPVPTPIPIPDPPPPVDPLPPSSGALATPTVTAVGNVTLMLALPPGKASTSLQLGTLPTQCDVKSRYADGSIKTAILSAKATAVGPLPVTEAASAGLPFLPAAWPVSAVTFTINGTAYTAAIPSTPTSDAWLSGPVVSEARAVVIPRTSAGTMHPFLSVVFDVRCYADGASRVDVAVGTTRNVAALDRVSYDVSIAVAGATVYARTAVEHGALMRWRKTFGQGLGEVDYDVSLLNAARAVPTYLPTVANEAYTFPDGPLPNGGQGYLPLKTGIVNPNFGDTGGRQDIGLFPRFQAVYLTHQSPSALKATLLHGELSGSWSVHITDATGNPEALVSIDQFPNWSTQLPPPNGLLNSGAGGGMSAVNQNPDSAHQPNLALLPYLLTGDRYYADQLAFWANWNMLHQPPNMANNCRNGSQGLMAGDQQRGWAWGVRSIGQAGAWLPDAHPFKGYFHQKAQNNLDWCDSYVAQYSNAHPLGFLGAPAIDPPGIFSQGNSDGLNPADPQGAVRLAGLKAAGYGDVRQMVIYAPWQYSFHALAIKHLRDLGYTGGTGVLKNLTDIIRAQFTHEPELPFGHAMMFFPPIAYATADGRSVNLANWGGPQSIHEMSALWRGDLYPSESDGGCPPLTVYGPMGRAALLIGTSLGADNAAILTRLMAYTHPATGVTEAAVIDGQPEWGFAESWFS